MILKTRKTVFVDSSFFKALIDFRDEFHPESVQILESLNKEITLLITSNFILDETITLLRVRCGIERVKKLNEVLATLPLFKIIRVNQVDEEKSWSWFWNDWSRLSYTDCVSFAVMKRLEITYAATFDTHFARAGFTIVKT